MSVPVISSNAGGIPEVNEHGISGFLSDVGNIDEMAENAISILKDEAVLAKFKQNAVKSAEKFDLMNVLPLYEEVYEKAYNSRFDKTYS